MRIFVYDENPGHEWAQMLQDPVVLQRDGVELVGGNPTMGDVLVCHRVQIESVRRLIRELGNAGIFIVEVGTNPAPGKPAEANYYRRAKGVSSNDPHFKACFKFFRRHLEASGQPVWNLLEGPPPPDALLAYHLLCLLPEDVEAARARDALAASATEEARTISDITGIRQLGSIDDPEQRRDFLRACA